MPTQQQMMNKTIHKAAPKEDQEDATGEKHYGEMPT